MDRRGDPPAAAAAAASRTVIAISSDEEREEVEAVAIAESADDAAEEKEEEAESDSEGEEEESTAAAAAPSSAAPSSAAPSPASARQSKSLSRQPVAHVRVPLRVVAASAAVTASVSAAALARAVNPEDDRSDAEREAEEVKRGQVLQFHLGLSLVGQGFAYSDFRSVWLNDRGYRLVGRGDVTIAEVRSVLPRDIDDSEAEKGQPAAAAPAPSSAAPSPVRLQLLRFLTDLDISGRRVLELFASGRLHFDRFASHTHTDWLIMLHVRVVELLRSGWLSEDMLFKMLQTRCNGNSMWSLDRSPVLRQFHENSTGLLTSMAEVFLPLTDACVDELAHTSPFKLRDICQSARGAFDGEGRQQVPRTTFSGWVSSQKPAARAAAAASSVAPPPPPPPSPPSPPKRPRSPSSTSAEPSSKRAHQGSSGAGAAPGNQQDAAAAGAPRAASARQSKSQSLYTLPIALLARLCDGYLPLKDFTAFALSFRAARQAVQSSQTRKGRDVWRTYPLLFASHPALKWVWSSKSGLLLLGQKSSEPGSDFNTRAVTAEQLKAVAQAGAGPSRTTAAPVPVAAAAAAQSAAAAAPAAVLAPRIELLRHLSYLAKRGSVDVLGLFATGHLHLHRFDSYTAVELDSLLHPQVVEVVRSGWLSEDMLFRLHEGHDRSWHLREPQFRETMLKAIVDPDLGPSAGRIDNLTSLAKIFLPLTAGCVAWLESQHVDSCQKHVKGKSLRLCRSQSLDPAKRLRFTIAAFGREAGAWEQCWLLHDDLQHGRGCKCPCTCGSQHFSLCKCCTGCKSQQVEEFEAAVAALASHFIGPPPTAAHIAEHRASCPNSRSS